MQNLVENYLPSMGIYKEQSQRTQENTYKDILQFLKKLILIYVLLKSPFLK